MGAKYGCSIASAMRGVACMGVMHGVSTHAVMHGCDAWSEHTCVPQSNLCGGYHGW